MTRESIKEYLITALDAISDDELNYMVNFSQQPDMLSVFEELTVMKGEMKKINTVSLKLNNNIQSIVEQSDKQNESQLNNPETLEFIKHLIEYQDVFSRSNKHFFELPQLNYYDLNNFTNKFSEWSEGYKIQLEKWKFFINKIGLLSTGESGEIFNPNFHEAIDVNIDNNINENIITDCVQIGYIYNKALIRNAKVIVNKHNINKK